MPENLIVPLDPGNVNTTCIPKFPSYMFAMPCTCLQFPHAASTTTNSEEDEEERNLPLKKRKL